MWWSTNGFDDVAFHRMELTAGFTIGRSYQRVSEHDIRDNAYLGVPEDESIVIIFDKSFG